MNDRLQIRSNKSLLRAGDVQKRIEQSLLASRDFDGTKIQVKVSNDVVILSGTVGDWIQREEVLNVGWCTPGVTKVLDRIDVRKNQQ